MIPLDLGVGQGSVGSNSPVRESPTNRGRRLVGRLLTLGRRRTMEKCGHLVGRPIRSGTQLHLRPPRRLPLSRVHQQGLHVVQLPPLYRANSITNSITSPLPFPPPFPKLGRVDNNSCCLRALISERGAERGAETTVGVIVRVERHGTGRTAGSDGPSLRRGRP